MKRIALGGSGLSVSEMGLGGLQFGYTADEAASFEVMDAYVEAGGNFIDTANLYSRWVSGHEGGESERVIGKWLAARGNRSEVVIATKVRGEMWPGRDGQGLGRDHIIRACEDSLRRLQMDAIDLYQCHWPDEKTPIDETLRAFEELIAAGKVRTIGVSNFQVEELEAALAVAVTSGLPRFESLQVHYNLAWRQEFEGGLAPLCAREGLAAFAYSPLAAGFLTGKYTREVAAKSKRASGVKKYYTDRGWACVEALAGVALAQGVEPATVAIAWLMRQDGIAAPILGANTVGQLGTALAGAELELADAELELLNAVSDWRQT